MESLGFKNYFIRVNNRKFLDEKIGNSIPKEKIPQVFRILDKLEKIGEKEVIAELKKIGCDTKDVRDVIAKKDLAAKDVEIQELLGYLKNFGFDKKIKVDATLVRGLDYYTSLVFEISVGSNVSCGGGGRYDDLISKIGGQKTPAVGISLGIDRIMESMKEQGLIPPPTPRANIFVANVDEDVKKGMIKVVQSLRAEGIPSQMNLTDRYLSKQLEFANSQGIRYVVIVGKEEVRKKKFKLRDMKANSQVEMSLDKIVQKLKTI
jgi:histidyl-tRNA synthetase